MITGARVFKTGLAVTISIYACLFLNIETTIFAATAAVLNLQPSLGKSLHTALEQILIHAFSISIAIIFGLTIGGHPLTMGLSTIIVILISNRLKWHSGMSGGIMATIFVLASPPDQFLNHAFIRSLSIFIGVVSALFVNTIIAPPRYEVPLSQKLLELNHFIFQTFSQAVQNYMQLIVLTPASIKELNKEAARLFQDVHHYYELYQHDLGSAQDESKIAKLDFYQEYLTYNKGLWQRTKDIFFLSQERITRRDKAGRSLPVSEEFQQILQLISGTLELLTHHNQELQKKITGETPAHVEEPHIWSKLDTILDQWHDNFSSNGYYHHALIEVALITYKIRWAAKEAVHLLDLNEPNGNNIN
jgi:uncharacterized membrane protein YgaE (UPF0421/DUF939 family)